MVQGLEPDGCTYLAGKVINDLIYIGCHVCHDPLPIASALLTVL